MQADRITGLVNTTSERVYYDHLQEWVTEFLHAKKAERVSGHTLEFYTQQLSHFLRYCDSQVITRLDQITAGVIRQFLLAHAETHNPGGQHAAFRVLRTFMLWFERETEPEGWHNPIHKVKPPKLPQEPLQPVEVSDVIAMVGTCNKSYLGLRDAAILLCLLDTGARAREFLAMTVSDVNLITGAILIKRGKGSKARTVFIGHTARKAIRHYLKVRGDNCPLLWVTDDKQPLSYGGLRKMLVRRSKLAGCDLPGLHDFRRAFALAMLRGGCDLVTLSRLMGHASLNVLSRYLRQITDDLQVAHEKYSPVDHVE